MKKFLAALLLVAVLVSSVAALADCYKLAKATNL